MCMCVCVLHTQRTTRRASSLSSRALKKMISETICMDLYTFPYVQMPPSATVVTPSLSPPSSRCLETSQGNRFRFLYPVLKAIDARA